MIWRFVSVLLECTYVRAPDAIIGKNEHEKNYVKGYWLRYMHSKYIDHIAFPLRSHFRKIGRSRI